MDERVWDSTSAFHENTCGDYLRRVYGMCLAYRRPTFSRGQDDAACYGRRLGELGEAGEISIASWNLLIIYIRNALFAFGTIL